MINKINLIALLITIAISSCNLGNRYRNNDSEFDYQKARVLEVIQTMNYSYLRVEKNKMERWIAVDRLEASAGDIVYFEDGLEMKNFESKELGRTFESVLFVQEISNEPIRHDGVHGGMMDEMPGGMGGGMMGSTPEKPVFERLEIQIDQPEGATSIGTLYAKRKDFAGKLVKVRGQVTKVNVGIMGRNWVHLQDGTADGENFDLTVTTGDVPEVGVIVTYSGVLTLEKDFGYGYYYEILLEEAEQVKAL